MSKLFQNPCYLSVFYLFLYNSYPSTVFFKISKFLNFLNEF